MFYDHKVFSIWVASLASPLPSYTQMPETRVELRILSARGLRRKASLLRPQWFAVAWSDPNAKYCTTIDTSGRHDASWGTRFSFPVDEHKEMALTVEVYRREPIFLGEHLQGAAVVQLKEYLDRFARRAEHPGVVEETASFQLRKKKSDKAYGLVDISVRICKEEDGYDPQEGFKYSDKVGITLAIEDGPVYNYPPEVSSQCKRHSHDTDPYRNTMPVAPAAHPNPSSPGTSYSYQPRPMPPPSSEANFWPSQFSVEEQVPQSYVNMPPRKPAGPRDAPGFGMALGAGALAAGAMMFGEEFLPEPSLNTGIDGPSLGMSVGSPF